MSGTRNKSQTAILLLAHGTPGTPDDVPAYMKRVTGCRPIPNSVIQEVQHRYALIGKSPLTEITMQQAEALSDLLKMRVYVGMRNWHPFIENTVNRMVTDGITHAVAICLAPQNSRTSVGLYRQATMNAAEGHIEVAFVDSWHDHPQLIAAFADSLSAAIESARKENGDDVPVIFTAHSVPSSTIHGQDSDPYATQAKHTAELVARSCGLKDDEWHFAFQSQGMSGGPWIGPTVEDTIVALQGAGHSQVLIQPVGFVCDHVEVLYDIDIFFKKYAADRGMKLWRAESLNCSPQFISALADLATTALEQFPIAASSHNQ